MWSIENGKAERTTFGYDAAGRQETVKDPLNNVTTTHYDKAGRVDWVQNAETEKTTTVYDDAGRVKSVTHTWDDENHRTVTELANGYVHTSTYNADGMRVSKEAPVPSSLTGTPFNLPNPATYRYVWDDRDLLAEYMDTGGGNTKQEVIYTNKPEGEFGRLVNAHKPDDGSGLMTNMLMEYLYDAQGTTTHVVGLANLDESSETDFTTSALRCDAFGELILGPLSGFFGVPHRYYVAEWGYYPDIRYTGSGPSLTAHVVDYYVRARNYNPATARWLSADPLGFAAGDFNLYRYVMNSPVLLSDPSGTRVKGPVRELPYFVVGDLPDKLHKNIMVDWEKYVARDGANSCCWEIGLNITYDKRWKHVKEYKRSVVVDEMAELAAEYGSIAADAGVVATLLSVQVQAPVIAQATAGFAAIVAAVYAGAGLIAAALAEEGSVVSGLTRVGKEFEKKSWLVGYENFKIDSFYVIDKLEECPYSWDIDFDMAWRAKAVPGPGFNAREYYPIILSEHSHKSFVDHYKDDIVESHNIGMFVPQPDEVVPITPAKTGIKLSENASKMVSDAEMGWADWSNQTQTQGEGHETHKEVPKPTWF